MTTLKDIQRSRLHQFRPKSLHRELTITGRDLVLDELYRHGVFVPSNLFSVIGMEEIKKVEWDGYEFQGRLITRLEQFFRNVHGVDLSKRKERLGAIIADNMFGGDEPIYLDFVNYIRWTPGTFKENPHSCWWGGYADGKRTFIDEMKEGNGIAIRYFLPAPSDYRGRKFYGNFRGAGRCFALLDEKNCDILFNGYGLQTAEFAKILLEVLDYGFLKSLVLHIGSGVYVNGSRGHALSRSPIEVDEIMVENFGRYDKKLCPECNEIKRFADSVGMCTPCQAEKMVMTFRRRLYRRNDPKLHKVTFIDLRWSFRDKGYLAQLEDILIHEDEYTDYHYCNKCDAFMSPTVTTCPKCKGVIA